MSAPDRRAMVERPGKDLSVRRQCALVGVARSGVYRPKPLAEADDLAVMRRIDELHLELPFYGSRRMTFELNKEGRGVNRKRVRRLMRVMGIEALVPRPGTSKAAPGHKIYPYLLRGLKIVEPNHVWAADVTYIPMACGFLYLVAIIDWASRAVLAWRLSNTNDASFCAAALEEALLRFGKPRIFNTDRLHFHRRGFHQQACDGRRRDFDGRTRTLHGQHFHRTAVALDQVRRSASERLRRWLRGAVRHQFLDELLQFSAPSSGDEQPDADGGVARRHGQNRGGGEGCGYAASLGQRKRVAHIPTAEAARSGLILEGQRQARLHLNFNDPWSHEWGPVHSRPNSSGAPSSRAGSKPRAQSAVTSTASTTFHQNTHLAMWLMRRDFAGRHHVPRGVLRTWRIARRA